jgi:hypothetical protein
MILDYVSFFYLCLRNGTTTSKAGGKHCYMEIL